MTYKNIIAQRLVKMANLDTLQKDLMNEKAFYDNYLKYTKDNPKKDNGFKLWWEFTTSYMVFYVYSFSKTVDNNKNNIHYGRVECTTIREKGHNDEITLSLLYSCGVGNEISDGNTVIGHLGIIGDIDKLISNIKAEGYPGDYVYTTGEDNKLKTSLDEIKVYAESHMINSSESNN